MNESLPPLAGEGFFLVWGSKGLLKKQVEYGMIMCMDMEDSNNLRALKESVDKILEIMQRPKKILAKILEGVAMGVGILSVLSTIDIIRQWFGG